MNLPAKTPLLDSLLSRPIDWTGVPEYLIADVHEYQPLTHADGTKRCYEQMLNQWVDFCGSKEAAFPAKEAFVIAYMIKLLENGLSPFTIHNKITVLGTVHSANEWPRVFTYRVRTYLKSIMKEHGKRRNVKRPLRHEHLVKIVAVLKRSGDPLRSARDRAAMWFARSGALRRSEAASACVEDVEFTESGLVYRIDHSKSDQYWRGQYATLQRDPRIEFCPVRALDLWLRLSGITTGPIFRKIMMNGEISNRALSAETISDIVQHYAGQIGLDPRFYGSHSLRRGWATGAHENGASLTEIQRKLRHSSTKYTRGYIEGSSPADRNMSRIAGA